MTVNDNVRALVDTANNEVHLIMSSTNSTSIGYGAEIPKVQDDAFIAAQPEGNEWYDLWEEIEAKWPLLEFHLSGNYWEKFINPSIVTIKSSVTHRYGYQTISLSELTAKKPSDEETASLQAFLDLYVPAAEPAWLLWSYNG